jgi:hypothetical protein
MTRTCSLVTITLVALAARALCAITGFRAYQFVLYQPESVFHVRVPSVDALAAYEKRLDKVCTAFFAGSKTPELLDIVVGLKPGKKVRVWFVSSRRPAPWSSLASLRKRLEAVPPCDVREGPIAFAINATIANAVIVKKPKDDLPPMPKEWLGHIGKGPVLLPDGVFQHVWPD